MDVYKKSIKKAIRLLDPETMADAISEIEYYGGFRGKEAVIAAINDACELACAALRAQQETDEYENDKDYLTERSW